MKVFVHRYKWSHMKRRKQLRKACVNGIAIKISENDDGWLYEVPNDFKIAKRG